MSSARAALVVQSSWHCSWMTLMFSAHSCSDVDPLQMVFRWIPIMRPLAVLPAKQWAAETTHSFEITEAPQNPLLLLALLEYTRARKVN